MAIARVVTDGAADLPGDLAAALGITVVAGSVRFGSVAWDGTPAEFWPRLLRSEQPASTAPPSVEQLRDAYAGDEPVLAVHVSDELSRTVEHARAAAADAPVRVIDSRSLSVGTGLVVAASAELAQQEVSIDWLADMARRWADQVHVHALLDDVGFLVRGGRAGLVRQKVDRRHSRHVVAVRGHAIPIRQLRHREEAIEELIAHVRQHVHHGVERWAVGHGNADDVGQFTARVVEAFGLPPSFVTEIGAPVGTHVGPAALVVGFLASS